MANPSSIDFTVLGGGGEVGASSFLLSVEGQHVLLDSGTHPKKDGVDALPAFQLLHKAPDAVVLSHGHIDHCGSLPFLLKQFPLTRIYMTIPTLAILDRMLHNSVSVMETLARERGIPNYPLYDHGDVGYAMRMAQAFDFNDPFDLNLDIHAGVTFRPAGHVLGSASVLLEFPGHTVYYTGDISASNQELIGAFAPLNGHVQVDTLIIESTRGATEEEKVKRYRDEGARMAEAMRAVLDQGGCVLLPCFALGRTQEMLNLVARLQEEGRLPEVPVYASGLGRAIYEVYERFDHYLRPGARLRPLSLFDRLGNMWDAYRVQALLEQPSIICATSGMMLENTPSALIAEQMVQQTQHGIFFVGYLDHETLGYKLLHAEPGTKLRFALGHTKVEKRLENVHRFDFSSHAPRAELREFVRRVQPKNVIYVHGDPEALEWMRENTGEGCQRFAPTAGQTVTLKA